MRRVRTAALLVLTLLAMAACTRRVQVESEPDQQDNNRMQTSAVSTPAEVDMVGTYQYVAEDMDGEVERGPLTIGRMADGGYSVRFGLSQGAGEVVGRDVRRTGNQLTMNAMTPGGDATIELTWRSANEVAGIVDFGQLLTLVATRQ